MIGCIVIAVVIVAGAVFAKIGYHQHLKKKWETIVPEMEEILPKYEMEKAGLLVGYVPHSAVVRFQNQYGEYYKKWKEYKLPEHFSVAGKLKQFIESYPSLETTVEQHNDAFVESEKRACEQLLGNIDGKSLDDQQRTAVVVDEDNTLILAGAGSGKTLTISGKVKYLCERKNIAPEDILLISYTDKAAKEMTDRIKNKLQINVTAKTFHKLGKDIVFDQADRNLDIASPEELSRYIKMYFRDQKLVEQSDYLQTLIIYFSYYLFIPADMDEYDSLGEMYEHQKNYDFETLRGKYGRKEEFIEYESRKRKAWKMTLKDETMKSLEEVSIANFLFLHGVDYEYERPYPHPSPDNSRRVYKPDFYLPEYDLYIEHFGINKEGNLPWLSPFEEERYKESMQWKREFHAKNETIVLETYSYYASEGRLLSELERLLKAQHVKFHEQDYRTIYEAVYQDIEDKYFKEFIKFCSTFITLLRSGGYTEDDIRKLEYKTKNHDNIFEIQRTALFKEIICPIYAGYKEYLEKKNSIDFSDMIAKAVDKLDNGYPIRKYKYIIIDEFQDMSFDRYRLLQAIRKCTNAKLFCVGDDWQSIYRFSGSDIALFTSFAKYFGYTKILKIEKTYRNSQELIDQMSAFVMKNPNQLKKTLRSGKQLTQPLCFFPYDKKKYEPGSVFCKNLQNILERAVQSAGTSSSVLFLGRTKYDFEKLEHTDMFQYTKRDGAVSALKCLAYPNLKLDFMSVHKAKGLEADNVILLNFDNELLGFPNKISDDPLMGLVLSEEDGYPYSEERRLLYVALTRTKNYSFVLYEGNSPSEFLREFAVENTEEKEQLCPWCKTGKIVKRPGKNGNTFYGCTNFPRCQYQRKYEGIMRCPECGDYLVKRAGRYGVFLGCNNYPKCKHTQQLPGVK